jgi:hypothetical protein
MEGVAMSAPKGHCAVVCVEVDRTGPVSFKQCRSGDRAFWEVSWNCERWLFLELAEAGIFFKALVAKYVQRKQRFARLDSPPFNPNAGGCVK